MNFGNVLYESKERVATITLNRPERFNAISETMPEDIATAFGHANNDDSVHVVVLTGAGRGFCGGYDLKAFAEKSGYQSSYPGYAVGSHDRLQFYESLYAELYVYLEMPQTGDRSRPWRCGCRR